MSLPSSKAQTLILSLDSVRHWSNHVSSLASKDCYLLFCGVFECASFPSPIVSAPHLFLSLKTLALIPLFPQR